MSHHDPPSSTAASSAPPQSAWGRGTPFTQQQSQQQQQQHAHTQHPAAHSGGASQAAQPQGSWRGAVSGANHAAQPAPTGRWGSKDGASAQQQQQQPHPAPLSSHPAPSTSHAAAHAAGSAANTNAAAATAGDESPSGRSWFEGHHGANAAPASHVTAGGAASGTGASAAGPNAWRAAPKKSGDSAHSTPQLNAQPTPANARPAPLQTQQQQTQPQQQPQAQQTELVYTPADFGSTVGAIKWFYLDPQLVTQGPFGSSDMQLWYENGFFDLKLPVQCWPEGVEPSSLPRKFIPLGVWFLQGNQAFLPSLPDVVEKSKVAPVATVSETKQPAALLSPVDDSSSYAASVHQLVADDDDLSAQDVASLERYNSNTQGSAAGAANAAVQGGAQGQQTAALNPTAQPWNARTQQGGQGQFPASAQQGVAQQRGVGVGVPSRGMPNNAPGASLTPQQLAPQQQSHQNALALAQQRQVLVDQHQRLLAQFNQSTPLTIQQFCTSLQLDTAALQRLNQQQVATLEHQWTYTNSQRAYNQSQIAQQLRAIAMLLQSPAYQPQQQQQQQQQYMMQKLQQQGQQGAQFNNFGQQPSQPQQHGLNDAYGMQGRGAFPQVGQQQLHQQQQQQQYPGAFGGGGGGYGAFPNKQLDQQDESALQGQFGNLSINGQQQQQQQFEAQQQQQMSYAQQQQQHQLHPQQQQSSQQQQASDLNQTIVYTPNQVQTATEPDYQQQQAQVTQQQDESATATGEADAAAYEESAQQQQEEEQAAEEASVDADQSEDQQQAEESAEQADDDSAANESATAEPASSEPASAASAPVAAAAPAASVAPWVKGSAAAAQPKPKTLAEIQAEEERAQQSKTKSTAAATSTAAAVAARRAVPFNTSWGNQAAALSLVPDEHSTAHVVHMNQGGTSALLPTPAATTPSIKMLTPSAAGVKMLTDIVPLSASAAKQTRANPGKLSKNGRRTEAAIVQLDQTGAESTGSSSTSPIASASGAAATKATSSASPAASPAADATPAPVVNAWAKRSAAAAPAVSPAATGAPLLPSPVSNGGVINAPLLTIRPKSMNDSNGAPVKPLNTVRILETVELQPQPQQRRGSGRGNAARTSVNSVARKPASSSSAPASDASAGPSMSADFSAWCTKQLSALNSDADTGSLAEFLMTLNSDDEVRQYVHEFCGAGAQADEFADGFLQLRAFESGSSASGGKAGDDDDSSKDKKRRRKKNQEF